MRVVGRWVKSAMGKLLAADVGGELADLRVGELEEAFEEAEFVEDFEGGGVDGVAAEVAEEVLVLFEDGDVDAGAGEQEAEHHAGGASADDAEGGGGGLLLRGGRGAHGGMRLAEGEGFGCGRGCSQMLGLRVAADGPGGCIVGLRPMMS